MRVLITGGTGFVGSHAIRALAQVHELFATARGQVPPELGDMAEWIAADLARPIEPSALPGAIDAVVHLAQSSHYRDLPDGAENVVAVNLGATEGLVAYAGAAGAQRFVLASTGGIYARSREPIPEDGEIDPQDVYFSSKREAELRLEAAPGDLVPIALRPFFVYGPGQRRMLIAGLFDRVQAGEEIVISGDPGLRSNPIYVGDAVAAIAAALDSGSGGACNLAGDEAVSITELVALVGEAVGREPLVRYEAAEGGGDLVADNGRMKRELGVTPRTSLSQGLDEMARERATRADGGGR